MNRKALITVAIAMGFGILAVLLVQNYIKGKEEDMYKGMELKSIIAVTKDIKAGTKITANMLAKREIPEKYIHGNAVSPKDANLVIGQTLNFPLKRGDALLWTDLSGEAERLHLHGLARLITKGERALSISVDQVGGVSGLLNPNDHIDILCTLRSQESDEEATITLLQNITVLATGNTLAGERSTRSGYNSLTLLVTPEEAELLAFAQQKAIVTAVLRNPEDIETLKDIKKVSFSDVMKSEFLNKIQSERDRIEVIKKGKIEAD